MTPADEPGAPPPEDEATPPEDEHTPPDDGAGGPEEDAVGDGAPGSDADDEAGEHPAPAPATWAGRARAGAEEAGGDGGDGSGFTDDFDEVERELGEQFDDDDQGHEDGDEAPHADQDAAAEPEPEGVAQEAVDEKEPGEEDEQQEEGEAPAETGSDTIEAETVALADREQAEEAALEGVRARATKHAAKVGAPAPVAAPGVAPEAAESDEGRTPGARPLWARFLAATLVIVISMATATSVSLLLYLTDIARGLSDGGALANLGDQLDAVEGGEPQTILILGSDQRLSLEGDPGRSDTTILLRVDPDQEAMALLSIPRDLKVNIPGVGVDKFNAAYSYGGPKLTLEVVKRLTGLDVNHVVNINFTGFADAVNEIDCVYVDVDRRYYIPPESGIAEIDIEAGYQRLCGLKALQYVRFRHDDNDLVRSARQQDFLREARQKVPPSKLIADRNDLIDIFTEYTSSDIDDPVTMLELLKTFLLARNATLNEVHFPAELGGPDSPYVTASQAAIKEAVQQFLGLEGTPGPQPAGTAPKPEPADGKGGKGAKKDEKPKSEPEPEPEGPAMIDATASAQQFAHQLSVVKTKGGEPMVKFPIFFPTRLVPGSAINSATRAFPIDGPEKDEYRGYKYSIGFPGSAGFTEYYGVSGTDWEDPPILENPSQTRKIDGREYMLFYDGDRLRLVGWKDKKASYWVINSLLQTLDEDEMISVATSMRASK